MSEESQELTDIKFWGMVLADARQTVICNPDAESRIKGWIDARGMGGLIKVVVSRHCPITQILIAKGHPDDVLVLPSLRRSGGSR